MISPERLDDIVALLKSHLAAEAEAGFPRLSLCPSAGTIKFLDYFATLSLAEREALLHALARVRAGHFFQFIPAVSDATRDLAMTDPALQRYHAAMRSAPYSMGIRHNGLRMTKAELNDPMSVAMRAQARARLDFIPRDDLPPALVPDPDFSRVIPAKAPMLRKLIDPALKQMFATEKTKRPGGETIHAGVFDGTRINVGIDYASGMYQLRYAVHVPDETKTIYTRNVTYEGLFAAGAGWDDLTEENAARSVHLLCDLVARVVRLRNAVFALARAA